MKQSSLFIQAFSAHIWNTGSDMMGAKYVLVSHLFWFKFSFLSDLFAHIHIQSI